MSYKEIERRVFKTILGKDNDLYYEGTNGAFYNAKYYFLIECYICRRNGNKIDFCDVLKGA